MVSGQAKTLVSTQHGIHLSISLPTFVTGTHTPPSNPAIKLLCIDFDIQGTQFAAELAIQNS
jgi:CheY-specific phosphatase CheX